MNESVTIITVKITKTIENSRGIGEVADRAGVLAFVHYSLIVRQEMNTVENLYGTKEVAGLKFVRGRMLVDTGIGKLISKERLTLHLQDGRKIDFVAKRIGVSRNTVAITGIGGFY